MFEGLIFLSFQTAEKIDSFHFFFFSMYVSAVDYLYFLPRYQVVHKRGSFAKVRENIL